MAEGGPSAWRDGLVAIAAFALLAAAGQAGAWWLRFTNATFTPEEYMARVGPEAAFVAAGALSFGGQSFRCGGHPTVLNPKFEDYAAAFHGFLIVNPKRFETLPPILQRYAYAHECGHQYVGFNEEMADCHAIRAGLAEGWLDAEGLESICAFISRSKGDLRHPPGVRRCAVMRSCFKRARPGLESPAS